MVSREWYSASGSPLPPPGRGTLVVQDTVSGLQQLAAIYRESFSIPVVGVGGSNGKTTTKEMLGAVLSTAMRVHMSHANLNNHLGVPLTLLAMRRETEIAVVEMGINHPGEMELLTSIARPSHGLLTNIGHEHLEFLVNLDGVARAERALFSFLDETGGTIFVNNDDPRLRDAATDPQRHILYGMHCGDCCSCRGGALSVLPDGSLRFMLYSERGDEEIRLNFTGRHNVLNALAAAAVGIFFGIEPREVRRGLEGLCRGRAGSGLRWFLPVGSPFSTTPTMPIPTRCVWPLMLFLTCPVRDGVSLLSVTCLSLEMRARRARGDGKIPGWQLSGYDFFLWGACREHLLPEPRPMPGPFHQPRKTFRCSVP